MKEPKCKICGGPHYKTWCFQAPKKPIQVREPLKVRRTPIKTNKKPKQKSDSERSRLIRQADAIFSIYIRLKDAVFGRARCVTCNRADSWQAMQNGHFISRRKIAIRWDEMNCHVQCPECNETLGGNIQAYKRFMEKTYGAEAVEELRVKSLSNEKVTNHQIQIVIDIYTMKVGLLQS